LISTSNIQPLIGGVGASGAADPTNPTHPPPLRASIKGGMLLVDL